MRWSHLVVFFLILVFDLLERCVKNPRVRVWTSRMAPYYCGELFAGRREVVLL